MSMNLLSTGNWTNLPPDLLQKIAENFTELPDIIRFSSVCVSWRSASKSFTVKPPPQFPWLLLNRTQESNNNCSDKCHFFSLSENRVYTIPLPESCTHEFFPSARSCWLTLGGRGSLSLLNPITRRSIPLPPLLFCGKPGRPWSPQIRKLKLFGSDLVAAFCPDMLSIFYCRLGETAWKKIYAPSYSGDFAYQNGSFFVINCKTGSTEVFDVQAVRRVGEIPPAGRPRFRYCRRYLVELPSGELLLVVLNKQIVPSNSKRFRLFQLDASGKKLKWIKVTSIGNCVLFVDADNAVCFASSDDLKGCRRNCIYFGDYTDENCIYFGDYTDEMKETGNGRRKFVGVWLFDIERSQVERAPLLSDYPQMPWPWTMWVVPSPC